MQNCFSYLYWILPQGFFILLFGIIMDHKVIWICFTHCTQFACVWGKEEGGAAWIRELGPGELSLSGMVEASVLRKKRENCAFSFPALYQVSSRLCVLGGEKSRNHNQNFDLKPKSSYNYTSTSIQALLFAKHCAKPSHAASASVAGLKGSGHRSRVWGYCHFLTVIASLDKRCFEGEDDFIEGEIKGSRGKPLPFSLNTGGAASSAELWRKHYSLVFRIC